MQHVIYMFDSSLEYYSCTVSGSTLWFWGPGDTWYLGDTLPWKHPGFPVSHLLLVIFLITAPPGASKRSGFVCQPRDMFWCVVTWWRTIKRSVLYLIYTMVLHLMSPAACRPH